FGSRGLQANLATFTSPSVSVNSLNRLTNRDTLYFTLYEPSPAGEPHWDGNLKAYKIGRTSSTSDLEILDANGNPAVDEDTGLFLNRAVSLWSSEPDGPEVSAGGVASRLSAQRNIYSNITGNANLSNENNRISRDNTDLIGAVPGLPQGTELTELIDFIGGLDTEGGARKILGDPLHSQPLLINFDGGPDDLMLVFGTNDGYLHAIDPTQADGSTDDLELFAFIPKELLPKQPKLKANLRSTDPIDNKTYGMDGPITAWIQGGDDTSDELIVESGDILRVYAGMRRGGRSYYALDLSDRDSPVLDFVIDHNTAGYSNLGQTWSSATYAKIKLPESEGGEKDVIIFGGGYDPNQDTSNSPDSMGNSIYIADATDGSLIWRAGDGSDPSDDLKLDAMTHSIPSDVRIIDTNGDGFINRMYVGDMGAQVWRFDINSNAPSGQPAITGGRIADLGGEGTANERRFYSAPSVSRYVENGLGFLAISLGSGFRADPLDQQIDDNFYVLRDNNVYAPALSPGENGVPEYGDTNPLLLITEPELNPLTLSGIEDGSTTIEPGLFGQGWFLSLDAAGEKSLSSAVTAEGRIFFTTYSPVEPELSCNPTAATGLGRFYGIDLLTGLPALFDDALTADPIASVLLGPTGIPPQPKLVFVAPDCDGCAQDASDDGLLVIPNTADIVALVGTQAFNVGLASRPTRTYWIEY
ncbi:MAG: pilus assembly protein, partial [Gammaproteobacteria bacterium]